MNPLSENDRILIGFLQKQGAKTVSELSDLMQVTETAVRQRLNRLIGQRFISRTESKVPRGRPVHKYSVTREGRAGVLQNCSDLATAVWEEVQMIEDKEIRSQVVRGIAKRLAAKYQSEIAANHSIEPSTRAAAIVNFFENRGIPATVNCSGAAADSTNNFKKNPLPIIQLHGCPYPGLSESDDLICEMEQSVFSELFGCEVELHRCHHNGESMCCSFQLDNRLLETVEA
ncbi:MAG: hypothetical protein VX438_03510 [Planctomycetota bacterium]|nr:hypothetical protein [Planctomycetota bacterium]